MQRETEVSDDLSSEESSYDSYDEDDFFDEEHTDNPSCNEWDHYNWDLDKYQKFLHDLTRDSKYKLLEEFYDFHRDKFDFNTEDGRMLFGFMQPNVPSSTPTAKLDKMFLKEFDYTQKSIPALTYYSYDKFKLRMTQNKIKKFAQTHPIDLGIIYPLDRVPCPIQPDPSKYQRKNCFAATDKSVRDVAVKILEGTTVYNPTSSATLIMPLPYYENTTKPQPAIGYLNKQTGSCIFFHKKSGDLWSVKRYNGREMIDLLQDPAVKVLDPPTEL